MKEQDYQWRAWQKVQKKELEEFPSIIEDLGDTQVSFQWFESFINI